MSRIPQTADCFLHGPYDPTLDRCPHPDHARRAPWTRFAKSLEALRAALAKLEAIPDAELDEPTRRLRDSARTILDRYDEDREDA